MQLAELMKDWPCVIKGSIRTEIVNLQERVQDVAFGDGYVARKGKNFNGEEVIEQAIQQGAKVIVVENETLLQGWDSDVSIVWVPNIAQFIGYAHAKLGGFPSEAVKVIAVTGTNGKTTVSHFIGQLLHSLKQSVMVIGTNGAYVNGEKLTQYESNLTTWPAKKYQELFQYAIKEKIAYVVLEASSMGLATHRLSAVDIDVGVFLNISKEHIEDHGTFEQYKAAKQKLATLAKSLVINADDALCRTIHFVTKNKKTYFALANKADFELQCYLEQHKFAYCIVQGEQQQAVVVLPFNGLFQQQNVLAAIATVCSLGFSLSAVSEVVQHLTLPNGRMQYIKHEGNFDIVIDYAHTPAAMEHVLYTLQKHLQGRLIVVFSCGGNRDKQKREKMGEIASQFADLIILTTDNARHENPHDINEHIRVGFMPKQQYVEILDREQAIAHALKEAREGDIVAIIGKGHERTQQVGDDIMPFSDYDCVQKHLQPTLNNEK